jgi:two-component system LytT family response regulator
MIKAVIIDDEAIGIEVLESYIKKYATDVRIAGSAVHALEGIVLIEKEKPDVVFLDISMPQMNGFELLEKLSYKDFKLVFTTAHAQHAIKAIRIRSFDYLLKPIDPVELVACLGRVRNDEKTKEKGVIELPVKDGILFLRPEEIIRMEASGSYTFIYLENGTRHVISKNLKEMEQLLDPVFFRCHNSHIINLSRIKKILSKDGLFVLMDDESMPELSKRNKDELISRIKNGA